MDKEALVWTWVIEALAKSEVVDTTLLNEVVSGLPLPWDDTGKQAKEAVALRCLEDLVGPSIENHVVSEQSKFRIDPTESCEAVLQWFMNETPESKDAWDELKLDVKSFVQQKKAYSPKSALEMIDDLISEGTHPLAASLKEMSGHAVQEQCVLNVPFDGGDPTSPPLRSDEDDYIDKTILAENDGCFLRSGIDEQPVEAHLTNGDALSLRNGISSCRTGNLEQESEAASHDMDNQCPQGKRLKLQEDYSMQSMQQHLVSVVSNQMCSGLEDGQSHEVIEPDAMPEDKTCGKDVDEPDKEYVGNYDKQPIFPDYGDNCPEEIDLALNNEVHDEQTHGKDVSELDKEHVETCDEQETSPNNGTSPNNAEEIDLALKNEIHGEQTHGKDVNELDKEHVETCDEQETSPNNGTSPNSAEEIDRALKSFKLSSRFASIEDRLAMTETERGICLKCNKDGQLLSCSASSCLLSFHERCLGCSPHFDDKGNFICPLCAYYCAKSEYDKAKQKVSVARKELSLFIGGQVDDKPEHDGNPMSWIDVNKDKREIGDKTAEAKNGANYQHKDGDRTAEMKEANVVAQVAEPHTRSLKGKQVELANSSAYMDVHKFAMAAGLYFPFRDRQGAEITIKLRSGQVVLNHGQHDGAKLSGDNELQSCGEASRCRITELNEEGSSKSTNDSDVSLQEKRDNGTDSLPRPKPISSMLVTPQGHGRRKSTFWTEEEEAALKKGVELYVRQDGSIPWKTILEYGSGVFQKGRTAKDLRYKWRTCRNAMRGAGPQVK